MITMTPDTIEINGNPTVCPSCGQTAWVKENQIMREVVACEFCNQKFVWDLMDQQWRDQAGQG